MPETSIIVVNASHSRGLASVSRSGIAGDCPTRAYNPTVLETLELETGASPTAAVIWLHGLGADGHDFEPIVPELDLPDTPAVRFVFPHAPMQPVTINGGAVMRAWYDVYGLGGVRREDEAGVRVSQAHVEALIARERSRGVPASRLVLAGFSQGGAIALHTGLRHAERLAGILALSTYLPVAATLGAEASAANRDVPIFMAHGRHDALIPVERAMVSRDALSKAGYAVEWHDYPMDHAVCYEEIADVGAWLRRVLV
jgi:phospholipase/carboxylesterase